MEDKVREVSFCGPGEGWDGMVIWWEDEKVPKVDGGDGCTKHANILNATELHMVKVKNG